MASLLARLVSGAAPRAQPDLKEPAEVWSDSAEATDVHLSPQRLSSKSKSKGGVECQVSGCTEAVSTKVYYQVSSKRKLEEACGAGGEVCVA